MFNQMRVPDNRLGRALPGAWDCLLLCLVILLAFWAIGPAGRVLAGGDLFTYFYPYWSAATRALRAGRLPLWNPDLFMGVPFLANSQAGLLYPPNWLLWLSMPAQRSLHWSVILHLCLAATGAYLYARGALRLGRLGAWTAGAALVLGGYLGAQVEHVNQLQALSWLPWLLLLYDRAVRQRGGLAVPALAAAVAMTLLAGHTQAAFIVLVGLGGYGLAGVDRRSWRRRVAVLAGAAAVGVLLAACQLVPAFELAAFSVRAGGLPFAERLSFSLSPVYLARALLPGYSRPVEPENIEYVATVGVSGLFLVACALAAGRKSLRDSGPLRGLLFLAGLGWFLALGLYNPLYWPLARFVPGFAHFRVPARWLALWAWGGAALAGMGIEQLAQGRVKLTSRSALALVPLAVLLLWGALGGRVAGVTAALWLAAAALAAALFWLARQRERLGRLAALGLLALLCGELLLSARTLPRARATAPQAYTSLRPAVAHLLVAAEEEPPARFLSLSELLFDPGDLPELNLVYGGQLAPGALYDLVVAAKQREVLSPNLPLAFGLPAVDGYDGGLLPLSRYLALQRVFLAPDEVSLDGRLRENIHQVPDGRWLNLLNVRYLITDKVYDAWIDDVFYDLQFRAELSGGERAVVACVPVFRSTALGLVSYMEGAGALGDGVEVGQVAIGFADGVTRTFPLRAGVETAEGLVSATVVHGPAPVGGHFWPGQPEGNDYVVRLRWDEPAVPVSVQVRATLPQGRLVVRGVSLVDERSGSFHSLVISDRGRFCLAHSGDVKVYENLDVLARAFVVHRARAVEGEAAALAWMQRPDFDPAAEVVVEGRDALALDVAGAESVRIVDYRPERVEIAVELAAPGYLVLSDAAYPGWRAWVDGVEAPLLSADLLFRALYLDPGPHQVVMVFQPAAVRWGALLSGLGGVGWGGLLLGGWRKRRRSLPGDAADRDP
ncbi:MAG: YfhO family protein [Anaerolineae bacterium]|nr:YfhO family protein [Anaerolineae bacterium]